MNDFGTFHAIELIVQNDRMLSKKVSAIVTQIRPELIPPYLMLSFDETIPDIPCFMQTVLVGCEISVHSTYSGDQELHELMSRINKLLDGGNIKVQIDSMGLLGDGVIKLVHHSQHKDNETRIGKLKYQIKIKLRRN